MRRLLLCLCITSAIARQVSLAHPKEDEERVHQLPSSVTGDTDGVSSSSSRSKILTDLLTDQSLLDSCSILVQRLMKQLTRTMPLPVPIGSDLLARLIIFCRHHQDSMLYHLLQQISRQTLDHVSRMKAWLDTVSKSAVIASKARFFGLLIYPGTKWCGAGNIAVDASDLGRLAQVDACCRAHDQCEHSIPGWSSRYGLNNTSFITSSHCSCDELFARCLRGVRSPLADMIGHIYFNVIQIPCFRLDFPIINCSHRMHSVFDVMHSACQSYSLDKSGEKRWQFFDASFYVSTAAVISNNVTI